MKSVIDIQTTNLETLSSQIENNQQTPFTPVTQGL